MSFSCQKDEFDQFFNRLDRPVEESRSDRKSDRFPFLTHSICMSLFGIWVCEVYDCRWLFKTFISKIFGFAVLKSLHCIILCQCLHPPLHILSFICISRFLLVNLSKFGAGMLIKCCILPSRNIKSAKASGAPPQTPFGEVTALPQTSQLNLNQFYV